MNFLNSKKPKTTSNKSPNLIQIEEIYQDKFSLIPDEILEIILGNLNEPTDIASISNASSVCERILKPSKSTWLFYKIFPYIIKYFDREDICNCRLVCTIWKTSVDRYLVSGWNQIHQQQFTFAPTCTASISGFSFATKAHLNRNPFPARSVIFGKISDGIFMAAYWVHVLQFLERFGDHIFTCQFEFQNSRMDILVIVLRQCLVRMKNLKNLYISWNLNGWVGSENKMREAVEEKSFPVLESLEHVKLNGNFNKLFYQKFVQSSYGAQLKILNVSGHVL